VLFTDGIESSTETKWISTEAMEPTSETNEASSEATLHPTETAPPFLGITLPSPGTTLHSTETTPRSLVTALHSPAMTLYSPLHCENCLTLKKQTKSLKSKIRRLEQKVKEKEEKINANQSDWVHAIETVVNPPKTVTASKMFKTTSKNNKIGNIKKTNLLHDIHVYIQIYTKQKKTIL